MIEDALNEVRTNLQAQLATLFDAEDTAYAAADVTEFGAAIVLRDVATYRFEEMEELELRDYPALLLLPRSTEHFPFISPTREQMAHTVDLVFVEVDHEPQQLARRMFRSVEAIRRCLTQYVEGTGASDSGVFQVDQQTENYSEVFELEGGGLSQAAVMTVVLHEWEERP